MTVKSQCAVCDKEAIARCSGCFRTSYCGRCEHKLKGTVSQDIFALRPPEMYRNYLAIFVYVYVHDIGGFLIVRIIGGKLAPIL
jgi:hypothetical protein